MEDHEQRRPHIGMDVIDSAGHFVGTVEHVEHDHFVVEKGFFFPESHRIGISAIESIRESEITLRIARESALSSDPDHNWAHDPRHGEIAPETGDPEKSALEGGLNPRKI